jgi:3-isopropylmalate/(R)-2-methylmalate dehydratase small subunit
MKPLSTVTSKLVTIAVNDIDTDQIIPARYLKTTDKLGLGKSLFANWRYQEDGSENPDFVLNQESKQGREILLAGDNFGCGSSREHAPWALSAWGFRVILSTSFADIFRNNALKNGLLLIAVDADTHENLLAQSAADADLELKVDLEAQTFTGPSGAISFDIDAFSKRCLLEGMDQLAYILSFEEAITTHEKGEQR